MDDLGAYGGESRVPRICGDRGIVRARACQPRKSDEAGAEAKEAGPLPDRQGLTFSDGYRFQGAAIIKVSGAFAANDFPARFDTLE